MTSRYQHELLDAMKPFANPERALFAKRYLNTQQQVLGLTVPEQRRVAAQPYSFLQNSEEERRNIWSSIWKETDIFEIRSQALLYYGARKKELKRKDWVMLKSWVSKVDNWEHSDRLSDLYAWLHEQFPSTVYKQYQTWSQSRYPWKRRAALTGLFYYASQRQRVPAFAQVRTMVRKLLDDKDVYVQKALGWTLRESFNVYPEQTFAFLQRIATRLPPAAWYAANEKLNAQQKRLLKQRRQHR